MASVKRVWFWKESIGHPKYYHIVQTIISTKISLIDTKIHAYQTSQLQTSSNRET